LLAPRDAGLQPNALAYSRGELDTEEFAGISAGRPVRLLAPIDPKSKAGR